jgi:DNA-binding transcriptional MerR regulator
MGYRIKTVARLTGIPRNTLLAWERRYELVDPTRGDNGYREYSDADIAFLRAVKRLVDQGCKISEAISLVRSAGAEGSPVPPPAPAPAPQTELDLLRQALLDALLDFDRLEAAKVLQRSPMVGYTDLIEQVYIPLLRELGDRWAEGEITVAQEHFASEFARERLLGMLVSLDFGPEGGRRAICAGLAGERHEGGLLAFAVQLAMRGFRITWLGPDVPWDELVQASLASAADLVCVSAVCAEDEDVVLSYVRPLRAALPPTVEIVVGGGAIRVLELPPVPGVRFEGSSRAFFELHSAH